MINIRYIRISQIRKIFEKKKSKINHQLYIYVQLPALRYIATIGKKGISAFVSLRACCCVFWIQNGKEKRKIKNHRRPSFARLLNPSSFPAPTRGNKRSTITEGKERLIDQIPCV